jgi:putative copper export protein
MGLPYDWFCPVFSAPPLADGMPVMDGATALRIASRALHLLCAIILGGGVFYMRSVLAHSGPEACFAGRREVWARWVAIASMILLVTGLYNYILIVRAAKVPGAPELPFTYHVFFGIKFALGVGVMFIAALVAGKTAAAERARANMSRWLNIAWTSVMAIVILGAMMRMLHP